MLDKPPSFLSDGFSTLERGVNSGRIPSLLNRSQVSFAVNAIFRGGYAQQRPGFIKRLLQFLDYYHPEAEFTEGRFQGIHAYTPPGGNPLLVASVSGRIYAIDIINNFNVLDVTPPDGPNSSVRPQAWFEQAEDWLLIQDGESRCIIFNGVTSRRAADDEVPTGTAMAYGMGRIWVARGKQFLAGDIFGGSSGTATYQYRDAILHFTENTYLNEGGSFSLPLNSGEITAMKFVAQLDTALGQGELLVGTAKAVFSVHVPVDRTQWKNLTTPIQRIALLKYGPVNQNSFEQVNSDYFFRAQDGVRSLVLAQRQFSSYGNVPLSREVSRVLRTDEKRLLRYSSAVLFDDRLLMTCAPHQVSGRGIYHRGLVVLDFDPLSSMDDKTPPEWDGLWTGINILQLVTITVRDEERCFAVVFGSCDTLELWEVTKDDRFDNGDHRVTWMIETPSYVWGDPFQWKRLQSGDLWIDRVTGSVDFNVDFRSDQYPGWLDWHNWSECAEFQDCYAGTYGTCRTIPQFAEQYRPRMRLPQPPDLCDETFPKYHRDGYEFQARITFIGFCRARQMRLHASAQVEVSVACQPAGVCKTLSVCDADPFTYLADSCESPYVPPSPPPGPPPPDCPECPDCPEPDPCPERDAWEGDPYTGPSSGIRIRTNGDTGSNFLSMAQDSLLPAPFLPLNTSFTVGTWIMLNQDLASSDVICRWSGGANEQWLLSYDGSVNKFYFVIMDSGGSPSSVVYTGAVTTGVWYLIGASFDYLNSKLRIWLDGLQSNVAHGGGMRNVSSGLLIGNRGGAGTALEADLDSTWIHRGVVWSDAAWGVLYNAGQGVRWNRLAHYGLPVPTHWYEYEDGTNLGKDSQGDPLYDLTNNNSTGGLAGLVAQVPGLPFS